MDTASSSKKGSTTSLTSPGKEVTSESFCRICLLKRPKLKSLMERIDGVMIPEMLYKLCGRQIEVQDSYPRSICQRCLGFLDCAYKFLNEFHQQDERLRSFYWSGSVLKRLQEYQEKADETVGMRMAELATRNAALFRPPAKEMCNKQTGTNRPMLMDADTQTDNEDAIDTSAIKTEVADEIVMEEIVMEEDTYVEFTDEENEEDEEDDGESSGKDKLVSMKIDVLESVDESEAYSDRKVRTKNPPQTASTRNLRSMQTRASLKPAVSTPTDTDDPLTDEDDMDQFEDSEMDDEVKLEDSELGDEDDYDEDIYAEAEGVEVKRDPLRCYICDLHEETEALLEQHLDMHSVMLPYACKTCHVEGTPAHVVKTISSLQNHFRSHHYPWRCKFCGKRFLRKAHLITHLDSHNEELLECNECDRKFRHRKTWQNHIKRHQALRSGLYKCTTCEKVFGTKARLTRHTRTHTGERPYGCKYCEKRFHDRHLLQVHTERHFRDVDCTCEYCGLVFGGIKKLDQHMIDEHLRGEELEAFLERKGKNQKKTPAKLKEKNCPFPDCNYVANTYGAMYVHRRTKHEPVHQCGLCSKSYAFRNQLETHMKLHTGEKPFKCEICNHTFRRSFSYKEHMQMHESNESYSCPTCNKSFKRPRYLQAHILTHSTERKFWCEICGHTYKTKGELKKHNKTKHGLDMEEVEVRELEIDSENNSFIVEYV